MSTIIEAIYDSGVLKPLDASGLQERHHYRLVLEEIPASGPVLDSDLAAEIEKRTTISPDGRIVRLGGVLGAKAAVITEGEDPVSDALEELRRERVRFRRV
jgi:predicted DNA-binding antitoxin AbrB/MazE fold protein